jgi:hypothetical protein
VPTLCRADQVAEGVVAAVNALLTADGQPAIARRVSDVDVDDLEDIRTRNIWVYWLEYGDDPDGGTRGDDSRRIVVNVDFYERCSEAGSRVPQAWVDARHLLFESICDTIGDDRFVPTGFTKQEFRSLGSVDRVTNQVELLRTLKLFAASSAFEYEWDT